MNIEKIKVNCSFCGNELFRYPSQIKISKTFFCNKDHHDKFKIGKSPWDEETRKRHGENHKGINNGNFGKKWSQEQKNIQSQKIQK